MNEMETVTDKPDDKFRKEYLAKGYRLCSYCKKVEAQHTMPVIVNGEELTVFGA